MKLEFGCGDTPRRHPEFLGVDVRPFENVTFVCRAWEIVEHVTPDSVEEIYSRHFLEHLTARQVDRTLEAWHTVLAPGGVVHTIVPDMAFHIRQWLDPDRRTRKIERQGAGPITFEQNAIHGFWGQQRGELEDTWDVHKSGWDFPLLRDLLGSHGFREIRRLDDAPKNLTVTCRK